MPENEADMAKIWPDARRKAEALEAYYRMEKALCEKIADEAMEKYEEAMQKLNDFWTGICPDESPPMLHPKVFVHLSRYDAPDERDILKLYDIPEPMSRFLIHAKPGDVIGTREVYEWLTSHDGYTGDRSNVPRMLAAAASLGLIELISESSGRRGKKYRVITTVSPESIRESVHGDPGDLEDDPQYGPIVTAEYGPRQQRGEGATGIFKEVEMKITAEKWKEVEDAEAAIEEFNRKHGKDSSNENPPAGPPGEQHSDDDQN